MDHQGLRSFRTWWISHGDSQHAGGVADALERLKPHQVIRPIAAKPTPTWGTIEGALEQTAIPLVEVNAGVQEEILSILHPFVDDSFCQGRRQQCSLPAGLSVHSNPPDRRSGSGGLTPAL